MSIKNTPGEWTVSELDATGEPSEFHIFIEPGIAVIERKVAGQDQHDMADAHLLSAAKELLEALELCLNAVCLAGWRDDFCAQKARAAIAKATGEPQ